MTCECVAWCDARYRGPGFIPLASIILLASGERRKSRRAFAVSAFDDREYIHLRDRSFFIIAIGIPLQLTKQHRKPFLLVSPDKFL
jgi:hypothetical protein